MGRMAAHRNFGIYALFHHNCERSVIWIIARASVGIARINLIEHIIDYLPIMHVGLEAGGEQAAHTKPLLETPRRSTTRAGQRLLVSRDRN